MRPRSQTRIDQGRSAKAAGDAWEAFIETHHEKAAYLGILAHCLHNQASSRVVGGRLIYVAKGGADYSGCLTNGLSFVAEAKSTKEGRLARSAIDTLQARHLDAVAKAGGLALLLVEFRDRDETRQGAIAPYRVAVPWLEIPWEVKRVAQSIGWGALQSWAIRDDCYLSKFFKGTGSPVEGSVRRRIYPRE